MESEDKISCYFQDNMKYVNLYENFTVFIRNCAKAFGVENQIGQLELYIENDNNKIKISNQKIYEEKVVNDPDLSIIFLDYKTIQKKNNQTPNSNDEIRFLNDKIKKIFERFEKLENDFTIVKSRYNDYEEKYYSLNNSFEKYKENQEQKIINLEKKINSLTEKINENSMNVSEEKPIKRKKINYTPKGEYNEDEKNIRKKTVTPNPKKKKKKIKRKPNETPKEDDFNEKKIEKDDYQIENNPENNNEFNEENLKNIDNNSLHNSKSSNSNSKKYNNKNERTQKSKIETPQEFLTCKIIIGNRIPAKLKSNYKGKNDPIKIKIDVFNNGKKPLPSQCYLKSKNDESDLFINDTIINNGKELKPSQNVNVTLFLFFKKPNNIKNGNNFVKVYLWNEKYDKIGEEAIITIDILDESKNIEVDPSKTYKEFPPGKKEEYSIFPDLGKNDPRISSYQGKPNEFSKYIESDGNPYNYDYGNNNQH